MIKTPEYKIRFNAVVIYIIVALIFAGTIVYIYHLRTDIENQKETVRGYYEELALTNLFIDRVNKTQLEANRYVSTQRVKYYRQFKENLAEVEVIVDSLSGFSHDSTQYTILHEIKELLKEKGNIVLRLSKQFNQADYMEQLDEIKSSYEGAVKGDSVLVATTVKDSIISDTSEKGFWKRLSNVFSPRKDTILTKRMSRTDTLLLATQDTISIIGGVHELTEQLSESYASRITGIEQQVKQLLNADHELSTKISHSVMVFYNHVIHNRFAEIEKSDEMISKNSAFSLIGGAVALGLILVFIILIMNDVNRSSSIRKMLEEANDRIKQTMKSRHRLLLSVSHDIKTPLNSILANVELNKEGGVFSEEDMHSMDNAGRLILSLLENLLHFSSLEQGSLRKENKSFIAMGLCRELKEMFSPLLLNKGLDFICEFNFHRDLVLKADELRIKQIVINLLSNSVKYTLKGSVTFQVDYINSRLVCIIADTGVGIPKEDMDKLFEPFLRVEQNEQYAEGSGFGMYVVKGLVNLLDGDISVVSEVKKGTTITVSIPVSESKLPEVTYFPKKIWIFDDDPSFSRLLNRMLLRLGHQADIWENVPKINMSEIDKYDMVLTDMEMGEVSGVEVLNEVRKHTNYLPVVIMTAQADFNEEKAVEKGFSGYLKKPVSLLDLKRLLGGEEVLDLQNLYEMFEDDQQSVNEVLQIFVTSTRENIRLLQRLVLAGKFIEMSSLCHKMLPMYLQIGEKEVSAILKKIETHRRKRLPEYPNWQNDVNEIIEKTDILLNRISGDYIND